jgi:hypothetical protein
MRAMIVAFVLGLALAASAQAAPLAPKPAAIELGTAPPIELIDHGCGRIGTASTGRTTEATGIGSASGPSGGWGNP